MRLDRVVILFTMLVCGMWAASSTPITCSADASKIIRVNEIFVNGSDSGGGFLELFVNNNEAVDITGWQVCYYSTPNEVCVDLNGGDGDYYTASGEKTEDFTGSSMAPGSFLVFKELSFGNKNAFANQAGEAVVFDGGGNAIHHLKYYNSAYNNSHWDSGGGTCETDYDKANANNEDICSIPDGQVDESDWGTDNGGQCSSSGTLGSFNAAATPLIFLSNNTFTVGDPVGTTVGEFTVDEAASGFSLIDLINDVVNWLIALLLGADSPFHIVSIDGDTENDSFVLKLEGGSITRPPTRVILKTNATFNETGKHNLLVGLTYDDNGQEKQVLQNFLIEVKNTGPALHYTFSDCTIGQPITTFTDVSGNHNDATAYNSPMCVDTGSGRKGIQFNTDASGTAYQLKNQYARTNANFSFTYDEGYTVFSRLRFNWSPNRIWALFFGVTGGDTCANNGAHWLINTQYSGDCGNLGKGTAQFGVFCGTQNRFDLSDAAGQDLTLATVYYSGSNKLITYINGVKVAEEVSVTDPTSGNAPVYIAQPWSHCSQDSYFSGIMDELRIYPRALSETEILGLFSSPVNAADNNPPTFENRRIGTKLAGESFDLWVAGLNEERDALQDFTKSTVKARVVPSSACPDSDEALTDWSSSLNLMGANNPARISFTVNQAVRDARVQFEWIDDGVVMRECSFDNFAVRPAALSVHAVGEKMEAGVTYGDRLSLSGAEGYDQNLSSLTWEADYVLNDGTNSGETGVFNIKEFAFAGAVPVWADINYSDVGRIELSLTDSDWGARDRDYGDCVAGSCSNTPDGNGLIGCNICGTADNNLTFVPYDFNITFSGTPRLDDNSTFTYYANDLNMSAILSGLDLHIEAHNKQGEKTVNYTDRIAGGYEKNIALTMDINVSSLSQVTLRLADGIDLDFIDGAAGITVDNRHFNYGKDNRNPRNPVKILGNDVNLSVSISDSDSVKGPFFKPGVDGGATFFYGRINPIDRNCIQGLVCPVTVNYEVYCSGCDQGAFSMAGWTESVNDVNWYVNPHHPSDQLVSGASLPFDNSTYDNPGSQILNYTNFPTGRKRVTVQHTDNIQAPSYLYYDPYSDQNISSFYLDAMENVTPVAPDNVIDNKGDITIGGSRIGE